MKCECVIQTCVVEGNPDQDLYVFHVIISKLIGRAASLISERQDLITWSSLKSALEQHFGDPRSEECIAIELETLKINNNESYLDFCNRIQHTKSTLIAKVNFISNSSLRESKITIYDKLAMNVFLYNLPEDLLRSVRLKACNTLENALSIVLVEVLYLGHTITSDGLKPNNDKIKAILNYPLPQTTTEIKSFLGLIGYYRRLRSVSQSASKSERFKYEVL